MSPWGVIYNEEVLHDGDYLSVLLTFGSQRDLKGCEPHARYLSEVAETQEIIFIKRVCSKQELDFIMYATRSKEMAT